MENITASFKIDNEPKYNHLSFLIICIFGVATNVLLLVAFIKDPLKCFRNSGTYLVMNLSLSDCLFCLFYSFLYVKQRLSFPPIFYFFAFWIASVSLVSITSISIDRFFMVAYPIRYRILMKGKAVVLWIAAIWIISCIIPVFRIFSHIHGTSGKQARYTFTVIVIILSAVMYSSTYYKLKKQSKNIALQNSSESRAQEIQILKEKRFLKTIIVIACITFVCVVPPMLVFFIHHRDGLVENSATKMMIFLSSALFFINFAINPLIYILRLPNYRRTFYLIYCNRGTASG